MWDWKEEKVEAEFEEARALASENWVQNQVMFYANLLRIYMICLIYSAHIYTAGNVAYACRLITLLTAIAQWKMITYG